jgi:O-antigen/teichoic acid export membrane protein
VSGRTGTSGDFEPDPLAAAAVAALVAGMGAAGWSILASATVTLTVLTSFVVWIRWLQRRRYTSKSSAGSNAGLPLALVAAAGWAGFFLLPRSPVDLAPAALGASALGLWILSRPNRPAPEG